MSSPGLGLAAEGVVGIGLGFIFLLIPNVLLEMLGIPTTDEPWIRAAGVFVIALGVHHVLSGRAEAMPLIRASVPERIGVAVALAVLAGLWGYWPLLLLALVPLAGAAWTWFALRRLDGAASSA